MPDVVKIHETISLPHRREVVWPILSRTDWVNRAIGLPPVKYEVKPLSEGGSEVTARARAYGLSLRWTEYPFEWTEPKFYQVRRVFHSGPLVEAVLGLRLNEAGEGCTIEMHGDFTPRNALGAFVARRLLGPKTLRDLRTLILGISENITARRAIVIPKLPTATANPTVLEVGLKKLRAENFPEPLVTHLKEFLVEKPDVEMSRIRPFAVAREWEADRWDVLKIFLHATRAGLLDLSWEILCPNCRGSRQPRATSLGQLASVAHCEVCNIKYDAEFDKSVELKFSVNPSLRPCDDQTFCLAGPGGKPHVVSQIFVGAGQTREWDVPELTHYFRLHSLQVKNDATLPPEPELGKPLNIQIESTPDNFALHTDPATSAAHSVRVVNPNPFPVQLVLETKKQNDDILTASRVTNWQEFRDLFTREVISPTERITVGSQVVLFTDLRGSTAMYSRIGDAPAYVVVRDHFKTLFEAVSAHHGSVVKTIGDAVMATFSNLPEGLLAVRAMHEQLARETSSKGSRLQLKSALHMGPCLAVNANERLDFFGTTVNFAARLVEHASGDDLILADEVYQRADTQAFLSKLGQMGVSGEEQFTGIPRPVKVWSIPMLASAGSTLTK